MGDRTGIEWTDSTWNPLRGTKGRWHCVRISGACKFCYAARMNHRFHGPDYVVGADTPRLDAKALTLPLKWRDPRRIFVCSMTDLFLDVHTDEWIDRIFAVMALAPQHTFQVLTKRPERMRAWVSSGSIASRKHDVVCAGRDHLGQNADLFEDRFGWPLPNVHLGVSVEDQTTAVARVPLLLQTPAAKRFVSYEPALGPVDFRPYLARLKCRTCPRCGYRTNRAEYACPNCRTPLGPDISVDWIIVGGESGPGARPFDVAWARSTIAQCAASGVACFVKQLGAVPFKRTSSPHHPLETRFVPGDRLELRDRKGGDVAEWPEDLQVREFPR